MNQTRAEVVPVCDEGKPVRTISQPFGARISTVLVLSVAVVLCDRASRGHRLAAQQGPIPEPGATSPGPASLVVLSSTSSEALLVDPVGGGVLARLPTGPEPRNFALSADGRFAYVTSYAWEPSPGDAAGRGQSTETGESTPPDRRGVTVIDLRAQRVHSVFQPGDYRQLGAVASGEGGHLLWVATEAENGVVELDASTGEVRMLWKTGGRGSVDIAVSDDESRIFTANAETDDMTVINRMTIVSARVATGSRPGGLAVAPSGDEVWVVNSGENTVSVVAELRSPREVRKFPSGGLEPVRIVFHSTRREAWVSHRGSRTIAVLAMASGERVAEIVLPDEPGDIIFSDDETRAYVPSLAGQVYTIDVESRQLQDAHAVDSIDGTARGSGGA